MGRSLPQLCGDQPHATFALCQTEPALRFHALTLIPIVLRLVSGFTLLGPPQSRAGKTDPMRLAIAEILPVSVDFVRQDPAGVMPLSRSEPLCHFPQISRLIVGVKRTALQPRPSVNDTDVQLRAKLHRLSRFSPHNGPNEGLAHADDPVRYAVCTVIVHVLLLLIDGADRAQTLRMARGQIFSEGQFSIDGIQVTPEV